MLQSIKETLMRVKKLVRKNSPNKNRNARVALFALKHVEYKKKELDKLAREHARLQEEFDKTVRDIDAIAYGKSLRIKSGRKLSDNKERDIETIAKNKLEHAKELADRIENIEKRHSNLIHKLDALIRKTTVDLALARLRNN